MLGSRALRAECIDIAFVHPTIANVVELHWRAHHFCAWPDLLSNPDAVAVQSSAVGEVLVPSDSANVIYLALHGTLHLWTRMKWLADIARLAVRRGPDGLSEDLELARCVGAFEPVALGLRLANELIGSTLPAELEGARARPIETAILSGITERDLQTDRLRFRMRTYTTAFRLSHGVRQKLSVARYGAWRPVRLIAAGLRRG